MKLSYFKIPALLSAICKYLPLSANAQSSLSGDSTSNSTKIITLPPTTQTIRLVAGHPEATTSSSALTAAQKCNLEGGLNCPFSYIIPAQNTQKCNIYGPLCQTGTITVGVDLVSKTTTTSLPCSAYLTAQSKYLNSNNQEQCAIRPFYPAIWTEGFGHSPECANYANLWAREEQYTLSSCGGNHTVAKFSAGVCAPEQIPPGVRNKLQAFYYDCCGKCTVDIPEVRLYYFQDEDFDTACQGNTSIGIYNNTTSPRYSDRLSGKLPAAVRTAILGTYTFTSPSVYLEIVGTATVSDVCGQVGPALVNPIVALPRGVLSTYSPPFPITIGAKYRDPNGQFLGWPFIGNQKPLDIRDLACPTFGLGRTTGADGFVTTTYGPPYLPIIIPPLQILTLDPSWQKSCGSIVHNAPGLKSYGIIDPPRILTPAEALGPPVPATVPALQTAAPLSTAENIAQPAPTTATGIPMATKVPKLADVQKSPPSDPPSDPPPSPPSDPPPDPPSDQKAGSQTVVNQPLSLDPESSGYQTGEADLGQNQQVPSIVLVQGSDPKTTQPSLGAFIFGALNGANLQPTKIASVDEVGKITQASGGAAQNEDRLLSNSASPGFVAIAGQTLTAVPSKVFFAGITLLPGDPGVSISGTPVSLAPSGTLFINFSPMPIADTAPLTPNRILTVAGQAVKANPTNLAIAGSYITPGGQTQLISGTPISLGKSGIIHIGDSTINLLVAQTAPASAVLLTAGGQLFTANPSGFDIGKLRIAPGEPAVTISGTPISLASSGVVFIGDAAVSLQQGQTSVPKLFTVADKTFTAYPAGFNIGDSRIGLSSPTITISGTPVFLGPSGILVIGSLTTSLSATPMEPSTARIFTVGGQTFSADPIGFNVAGSRVVPGGTPIILAGTTVSLSPSGVLNIGDSAISLPTLQTAAPRVYTVGGLALTAESSGAVLIGGTTIVPGGLGATISGKPISLAPSGVIAIGSSTYTLPVPTTRRDEIIVFTTAGLVFTRKSTGQVIFNGTSISPGGPPISISGTQVSLNTQGRLVVGTSIVSLSSELPGPTEGTAAVPLQGFSGGAWRMDGGWRLMRRVSGILLGTIALKWLLLT